MNWNLKPAIKLTHLINLILIQSFIQILLIALSHDGIFPDSHFSDRWIGLALIINMLVFIMVILNIQRLKGAEAQEAVIKQQKESLNSMGKLVETILQQKHDFANHLQVISGLSQLNNYDELKRYVQEITNEVKPQFQFIALSRVELKSLLFIKAGLAKEQHISFDISVEDDFEDFPLCQIAAVNLIGNLINNAFAASLKSSRPKVSITLRMKGEFYIIKVTNNGKTIPPTMGDSIFDKGYTTKKGGGLGLHIVKNLVDRFNGQISYTSNAQYGTEFTVKIPEKRK